MAMTEERVREIFREEYEKQFGPKTSPEWTKLRKEIIDYCKQERPESTKWYNLQQQIYTVIRATLGIHRIDKMTDEEVPQARKAFEFIKRQREEVNNDEIS
ncbi:hypothetical protein [Limosilactobacillus caecicola]|uniref:hypothetical protein n=1 Tax=Limosilactobacillus caecicola TaxID=2941332 RepID=UPI00203B4C95|nr:hypothetical protein [Limosilactobacillus caecicola]